MPDHDLILNTAYAPATLTLRVPSTEILRVTVDGVSLFGRPVKSVDVAGMIERFMRGVPTEVDLLRWEVAKLRSEVERLAGGGPVFSREERS